MAVTHSLNKSLLAPEGTLQDSGVPLAADTSWYLEGIVPAYLLAGAENDYGITFPATSGASIGVQSVILLSTVPCTIGLAGASTIDGVTANTVTLVANQMRHITSITGTVTSFHVLNNSTIDGAAGTIKIAVLFWAKTN